MKIADTIMKFLAVAVATSLPLTAAMAQPAAPTPIVVPTATPTTVTTTTVTTPPATEDPVASGINTVAPGVVKTAAAIAQPATVDTASPVATVTSTTTAVVPPVPAPPPAAAPTMATGITNAPAGMPSVVGEVMQNLQQSQNNLSLNDMAKAQDALVRLNLMLDIEKKMGDLKKVQDDRNGVSSNNGGGMPSTPFGAPNLGGAMQVPASALALPEPAATAPAPERHHASRAAEEPASSASDYTVEQISGTNGNLVAVLTSTDGTRKNVRVGDTVGSRLKVASISGSGVELQGPKGSKTIGIENNGLALAPMMR